jgi:hypothetical protein
MALGPARPPIDLTVHTQYRINGGGDAYAGVTLQLTPTEAVITVCGPGDLLCESRRVTNDAVLAFLLWYVDTATEMSQAGGA